MEKEWSTKEGGAVTQCHPAHVRNELGKEDTQCPCYNPAWAVPAPEAVHSSRAGERKADKSFFQVLRTMEMEKGRRSDRETY